VGTTAERFWRKVDKSGDCWEWTAAKSAAPEGFKYGNFQMSPKVIIKAHRASWIINIGPIPDDLHVLHKCRKELK
jgi:hypothetical protein